MRMKTNDEDLALAAAAGDRDAFCVLIERHYDRIHRMGWRLCGTAHDAEDLAHDIMAALPAKLRSYRGEAKFTTWLYRVVMNAATDRARKAQRRSKARQGWGEDYKSRAAEAEEAQESYEWLTIAMRTLPPELRETVALTLGEDLTQKEAAQVLGLSEGTIAWRMSDVKKHLRALAQSDGDQPANTQEARS
jgi:RNA polymerase sigma-70 factor (ECF subfamily)